MTLDSYRSLRSTSFLIQNMAPKTLGRLVLRLRSPQQPKTPTRQWTNAKENIKPEGYTHSRFSRSGVATVVSGFKTSHGAMLKLAAMLSQWGNGKNMACLWSHSNRLHRTSIKYCVLQWSDYISILMKWTYFYRSHVPYCLLLGIVHERFCQQRLSAGSIFPVDTRCWMPTLTVQWEYVINAKQYEVQLLLHP